MTKHLSPSNLGLPPPAKWTLLDGDRVVGWTTERVVGFRGFASETEAAHAAWVAYRVLTRRLARTHGTRPVPVDAATALTIRRSGDRDLVLADGRVIAALVRPAVESPSGPEFFGFELDVPEPADDLRVRAMAHLMYRAIRKSGLSWALWRSTAIDAVASAPVSDTERAPQSTGGIAETPHRKIGRTRPSERPRLGHVWPPLSPEAVWATVTAVSVVLLLLAFAVSETLGIGLTIAGIAGLVVSRILATRRWVVGGPAGGLTKRATATYTRISNPSRSTRHRSSRRRRARLRDERTGSSRASWPR
jgi:hypothetical protein